MGDELNDGTNITGEFRRRRPIPIPLYDDRYVERPYLKKFELAKIRDNLDELVEIKEEIANKSMDKSAVINNTPNVSSSITKSETAKTEIVKPEIVKFEINKDGYVKSESVKNETVEPVEIIKDVKLDKNKPDKSEVKIGISNLAGSNLSGTSNKKTNVINKQQINKNKKVYRMNNEDNSYVDVESAFEKLSNRKETERAMRESAELARQNKIELANLKSELAKENERIKNELKSEFGNKFNEFGSRFNELTGKFENVNGKFENINGKFDGVSKKLEETCTGIDCLKKDLANINKNMDLVECPECHKKVVPPLSSYCPNCQAKMHGWFEDDGVTPVKGWKPSWEEKTVA